VPGVVVSLTQPDGSRELTTVPRRAVTMNSWC
jgi:hypothetical protein